MFNKASGFKGVGGSSDSRDILAGCDKGDRLSLLANKLFVRRVCDFIGQYFVRLGGCDLIIFSAGIGENEPRTRKEICKELYPALGVVVNDSANDNLRGKEALISAPESKIKVAVIPTDEEVMIARDAYKMCILKEDL